MRHFKAVTKVKQIMYDSRPHAEMVYWALNKAKADWTEEERVRYEPMMKDALKNLERYFAQEEAASCS
jgi:hypothetical protein